MSADHQPGQTQQSGLRLVSRRSGGGSELPVDSNLGAAASPLYSMLRREPVTLSVDATIREAALLMRDQKVSSVLLMQNGKPAAILTDRDLRNRVVAAGLDSSRPAIEAATLDPITIDRRKTTFDALLLMARHNIHHLPVMGDGQLAGMLTSTDLTERHSSSAVFLAAEIHDQDSVDGLARISTRIRELQRNLAAADATAFATGQMITAITDSLTRRLLQLAHDRFGPAPVPYAWVAAGSQARAEQTAKSDQDNCMILDDAYKPAVHGDYFRELARFVCAGLDACGYVYCPGEMMAQNDTWRQPLTTWKQYFHKWIEEPEPMALMLTCVFFDLRFIDGSEALVDELRADFLGRAQGNGIFLAYMVGNALKHRPPLNLIGRLSVPRSGEHAGRVDLKHEGSVPVIDLARVYALAAGNPEVNTWDRLEFAERSGEISEQSARDLRDALEFLAVTRIRHQVRLVDAGQAPDNYLTPSELSNFERTQLRNAFSVVQTLQKVLGQRYQAGRF